jgi:hypothetical protein
MRRMLASAALGVACVLATPALAMPKDGLTAKDVADWLRHQRLDAEVEEPQADAGATVVRSSADGAPFAIYLYDCRKDRCASLQYVASFPNTEALSLSRINAWNRRSRYVRAYIDRSGRVLGEYDLDVAPGLDEKALDHSLRRWRSALARFKQFVSGL